MNQQPARSRKKTVTTQSETPLLTLVFTGERRKRRFRVIINGSSVMLTRKLLQALIDLILARTQSEQGFTRLPKIIIFRLRQTLDKAVAPKTGKTLIETGGSAEYRLVIPGGRLSEQVRFTNCFAELCDSRVITS